ncbi:MAG: MATE family efflux transporter, partial [Delftia sp.]|nr:MATE family efflux transporter [Delftia sp.]
GRLGSAALAAVTISMNVRWVLNSLANGLGIGGTAVVARRIGERKLKQANHAAAQIIILAVLVSLALGALGIALAEPAVRLLGAQDDVLDMGVSYLRILFGGLFTFVVVLAINALLRGAGDARLAMWVLVLSQAVTIILLPLLLFGWGPFPRLDVYGSAWAGVLGFGSGLFLQGLILLPRPHLGQARITLRLGDLRPDPPLMWHIIKIALPSTIQMTLRASSRLAILSIVGLYGTFATAAYGVSNRLLLIALIPGFGLANAAGTMVGQNLGAGKPERAARSAWWVVAYNVGLMTAFVTVFFFLARPLIAVFDDTPRVVDIGADVLHIVAPSMILSAVGVVLGRAFDGAGNTVPAMIINLLSLWALEVPLSYGLAEWADLGLQGVWIGRAIANLANGALFFFWFRRGRWKRKQV